MTSRRSSETGSTANGSYPSRVGRPRKHKADIPLLRSRRRARHLPPRFFPRLHPAAGVTGLRATASVEPYAEREFKDLDKCWQDSRPENSGGRAVSERRRGIFGCSSTSLAFRRHGGSVSSERHATGAHGSPPTRILSAASSTTWLRGCFGRLPPVPLKVNFVPQILPDLTGYSYARNAFVTRCSYTSSCRLTQVE